MSQPVLVRSSMRTWDFVLLLLTGIGIAVGGWVLFQMGEKVPGAILQVIGGTGVLASAMGLNRRIRRRQWVRLEADGFTLIDRQGEADYEDAQVRSLTLRLKQNFSEGVEQSVTRTLLIWLDTDDAEDGELTQLEFKSTFKPGVVDPLSVLIDRLSKQVCDRARELLSDGSTFSGDGWVLKRQNLVIAAKPEPLHCPLNDIEATGVVDQKLCLWRRGLDEVWGRINIDSVNAYVLKWLIDERLAERPSESESARTGDGLGRVIFERKSRSSTIIVLALGIFALLLLGLGLVIGGFNDKQNADRIGLIAGGLGALLGALACLLGIIHCRRFVFRCHQYGLVKRGLGGEKVLRYEHVESFTYHATRHFHNGVYTGTIFMLDFEPNAEHKSQRIKYSVTLRQSDEELNNLRDQVSSIIGQRMRQDVLAGCHVKWTPAIAFHGVSLVYTPVGFIARKAPEAIPLAEIELYKMDQGQCQLFRKGQKKAVINESMHAKNFFPGFHCMLSLISAGVAPELEVDG